MESTQETAVSMQRGSVFQTPPVGASVAPRTPVNQREQILQKIRERVNAGKHYQRPAKLHELKANNPFFNGALALKNRAVHTQSPSKDETPSLEKMLSARNYQTSQESALSGRSLII